MSKRHAALSIAIGSTLLACGAGPSETPSATSKVAPTSPPTAARQESPLSYIWTNLETVPYKGKQDDIFFVDADVGFYGNGAGKIYKTTDGGAHWTEKFSQPGTYVRALGFLDGSTGFAGNIGTDYFPGVTDTTPMYETRDGGDTWTASAGITGDPVKGLCAIDVLDVPFINAGKLDHKKILHAVGRVGGPAVFLTSTDNGHSWNARDMKAQAGMLLDVKFLDAKTGFLCAGSDSEVERSHALILKTKDGGATWAKTYESKRAFEDVWKCAFPTKDVGYATVQSYDEDPHATQRYVAKTVDGGDTWSELPMVDDAKVREFGIGFVDENVGWVGAVPGGFQTVDGGKTWTHADIGKATNKIRIVKNGGGGTVGYAIGVNVYKLTIR